MAADFHGKVRDKRCRKPLYTPSNWDPKVDAARSAELPNARLVLQFVYGFNGEGAPSCLAVADLNAGTGTYASRVRRLCASFAASVRE